MKVKTSITLSASLLKAIDAHAEQYKNRSVFLETAAWAFIRQLVRDAQDCKDLDILNGNSSRLNKEAANVLGYQVDL